MYLDLIKYPSYHHTHFNTQTHKHTYIHTDKRENE